MVLYALSTLVADMHGNAINGTGITDMLPMSGLSIHIHDTNFNMLACGNIGLGAGM